jgi:hypothetical protein
MQNAIKLFAMERGLAKTNLNVFVEIVALDFYLSH